MSNATDTYKDINSGWGNLLDAWHEAQSVWNDETASQFSKQFLSQWEEEMPAFLSALEELADELESAKRELR